MKTTMKTKKVFDKFQYERKNKKPPDKLRTIKCALSKVIINEEHVAKLFDATCRTNKIITHTYHFLRLWILSKYHNGLNIPTIDVNTIKMVFKCFISDSCGPKPKGANSNLLLELKQFYSEYSITL